MLPLFHDFEGRSVVIVGGGRVALRKARTFAAEADVTVVADAFADGFDGVDCQRRRRRVEPDEADELLASLKGELFLVIPATDDRALNDAIARAGREADALVNRVDERGDTVTPARAESGPLTVAISTGGESPAVARHLRREIEPLLERTEPMVALQADLRNRLGDDPDLSSKQRRQALRRVIDDDGVWRALEDGRHDDARDRAIEIVWMGSTE
ncbi:Siroheme synthase (precorrin-2 oxidase/ferrochelatase domain) [Halalkaliarchaeum sp. AArc-CO]|uniref:precorrin-2 dehydrogenase/sirohydrochlorin ferrochelatase family protein n=1 Tax=Halalkaliarchaeum sp. AArc-CO TaxID=2866381 RepID=UPI00217E9B0F|nr:bifunctional precorrin-2 dehydrogenase/sirohydrochlorin ferrochelatase [Halalkaliarchaeum sp. AArc-CO]UWG52124.1 Siroheme synthase (precorrin-2 oxidase/ferrochelatase domain) [Halalkaliarchaeum sp. AArc-CO]